MKEILLDYGLEVRPSNQTWVWLIKLIMCVLGPPNVT